MAERQQLPRVGERPKSPGAKPGTDKVMPPLAVVPEYPKEPAPNAKAGPASGGPENSAAVMPFQLIDRMAHAGLARFTAGLSPAALLGTYSNWAANLLLAPGKQLDLVRQAFQEFMGNVVFASRCAVTAKCDPCQCALPQDNRFRAPEWQVAPFNIYAHNFLSIERWWEAATTGVAGLSKREEERVAFAARQALDTVAPSNFVTTNPQVLTATRDQLGANLVRGWANLGDDIIHDLVGAPPVGLEQFKVGGNLAVTPGKVVYRTHLAEIIQYAPTTDRVRPEPVVIVPAWIMKYYILDLSPHNSLVKYLTEQGFTVFMVSWKNPGTEDRNTEFDEYRTAGVLAAIDAATAITGARKVHAVGYCLGGTLLAIAAAAMARDGDDRLASLSFFAAQTDFTEAGELMLFINENQVKFLEDMMWERGYLEAKQMSGTFQFLRSNDLIWSRNVQEYLMGERQPFFDIMAWDADSTRLPYRMQSEYLRSLLLNNDLAEGRYKVDDRPVLLIDIGRPLFVVATERDHIAPWHSVFKFHAQTNSEITFVLTSGGHNGGILSAPGREGHHFRSSVQRQGEHFADPDNWLASHTPHDGSWWPKWASWLASRSGAPVPPPPLGNAAAGYSPLEDAPGRYVLMK
jgi:poly[(R)-3-hydroxyalkanoate] polymerase subunit PhaC